MSSGDFKYSLVRKARKTLEIAVLPGGKVSVKAPLGASDESVECLVAKRAAWIRKQIAFFRDFEPRPRHFVAGETHLFLGRRYRLRVRVGAPKVAIEGEYLVVTSRGKSPSQVARAIDAWQREQAKVVFPALMEKAGSRIGLPVGKDPRLCVKALTRRWGSMSGSGTLTLNLALIQAPRACIEYVICHELCHVEYPGHGPAFYAKLEGILPDWKERKLRLERLLC